MLFVTDKSYSVGLRRREGRVSKMLEDGVIGEKGTKKKFRDNGKER